MEIKNVQVVSSDLICGLLLSTFESQVKNEKQIWT